MNRKYSLNKFKSRGAFACSQDKNRNHHDSPSSLAHNRWDAGSYVGELAVGGQLPTSVDIEQLKDKKQQEIFLLQLKIRELTGRLGLHNLGIPTDPKDRSPSPEPIYNDKGVRVNTRLERTRTKLVAERTNTITR